VKSLACLTAANRLRTVPIVKVSTESPSVKTFVLIDYECAKAKPGQFLMLWIPGVDEIPLSIMDVREDRKVAVAVKAVGEATRALHQRQVGDAIGVRGPFGNSFTMIEGRPLIVGGGTGVAPLLFLTRKLVPRAVDTTFLLGARTRDELLFKTELERLRTRGVHLVTSTEDGSCGLTGLCTEPLKQMLTEEKFDVIYACGPEQMIVKVFELAQKHRTTIQVSLERLVRCAIGLCGSCTVGRYRVCVEGPIFTSKQLKEVKDEFGVSKHGPSGKKIPLD
jgi:dihydroorotate dehydrogenase electron transfer subunit